MWWSSLFIFREVPQWGKDDGDYDSPTSWDETPDNERRKKIKNKKKKEKGKIEIKKEKEKINKERRGSVSILYHTCASK